MTLKDLEKDAWKVEDAYPIPKKKIKIYGTYIKIEDIKADIIKTCKEKLKHYDELSNAMTKSLGLEGYEVKMKPVNLPEGVKALMEWAGIKESELE